MSNRMQRNFKLTALAAALLSVYGPALAEDGARTSVVLDPNSVSIGIGNWSSGDRLQGGIYDGMRDDGGYGLLDADILKLDAGTGTWMGLKARNLGMDNRELKGEWQRQGNIGASIEYSEISRYQPFIYNTGVTGIGSTVQTVPSPSITPGTGANVELHTKRERWTGKFFKNFMPGLNFNVSYRNEKKDGTRAWGRGGTAEFAVEPIDSTIQILDAALSFSRGPLQLSGGYYGTSYDNANSVVVTANSTLAANSYFNLSLPLDNKSHEVYLNGGYDFTKTTRGTFKMSYSKATQDEALPMTQAGLIFSPATQAPSPLAPRNLDGRLDTTLFDLGLTSRPTKDLSVVASLRYRDFADKTPLYGVVYSGTTPTVYNTPFSYTNKTGKLEGTYRLPQGYSATAGIEYKSQDRQAPLVGTLYVPFRTSLDETTWRIEGRKSMSETVNGSLAYLHSKRDGSNPVQTGDANEDAVNPLNIADRKRDKWRGRVDWSPTEKVTMQFVIEDSKDDYGDMVGPRGLQDGKARLYALDGSFQINTDWAINAWYARDETKANEITSTGGAPNKYNELTEKGDSFGVGANGRAGDKLRLGGKVEQFRSKNTYNQTLQGTTLTSGLVPTPDITNTMLRLSLWGSYAVQKNGTIRADFIHEKWSTNDWSWMMFPASGATPWPYGSTTDGTTVLADPKQNATFVGVRYIYKFQ